MTQTVAMTHWQSKCVVSYFGFKCLVSMFEILHACVFECWGTRRFLILCDAEPAVVDPLRCATPSLSYCYLRLVSPKTKAAEGHISTHIIHSLDSIRVLE